MTLQSQMNVVGAGTLLEGFLFPMDDLLPSTFLLSQAALLLVLFHFVPPPELSAANLPMVARV